MPTTQEQLSALCAHTEKSQNYSAVLQGEFDVYRLSRGDSLSVVASRHLIFWLWVDYMSMVPKA